MGAFCGPRSPVGGQMVDVLTVELACLAQSL